MLVPYCLSFFLFCTKDLNVRDIDNLSFKEKELQEQIASREESIKRFQDEEKSLRNQAANLRKQKVGNKTLYILIQYTDINLSRDFLLMKGAPYMYC
jgi:hypothetical protein